MKKILLAAVMALFMISSCNKADINNNFLEEGSEATLDLVISFPATRAADSHATTDETKVTTVTVFVFNPDGTMAKMNTGNVPLTFTVSSDFTAGADNTYSLNQARRITSTSGLKHIYVGVNLPSSLNVSTITNVSDLLGEYATTVANLTSSATGFAMLSAVKEATLLSQEAGSTPTVNKVTVQVERLVAKVTARKAASPSTGTFAKGFTIQPDQFTVSNVGTHIYPIQQFDASGNLKSPMKNSTAVGTLTSLNENGTTTVASRSLYVNEYRPGVSYLRREATNVVVRGALSLSGFAFVDGSDVLQITGTPTIVGGEVFMVKDATNTYFCKDVADAVAVETKIGASGITKYTAASDGKIYFFYYIFLNENETDAYAIYRNQYIDLTIGQVRGVGYPGDPVTPDQPATLIPDPDLPLIETAAYLEVIVDVKNWAYKSSAVTLD